jgi:hypothetical protein
MHAILADLGEAFDVAVASAPTVGELTDAVVDRLRGLDRVGVIRGFVRFRLRRALEAVCRIDTRRLRDDAALNVIIHAPRHRWPQIATTAGLHLPPLRSIRAPILAAVAAGLLIQFALPWITWPWPGVPLLAVLAVVLVIAGARVWRARTAPIPVATFADLIAAVIAANGKRLSSDLGIARETVAATVAAIVAHHQRRPVTEITPETPLIV